MKITYKINVYNLLTYLLVFAIIKLLPAGLRQASKIIILISVFCLQFQEKKKKNCKFVVVIFWLCFAFSGYGIS